MPFLSAPRVSKKELEKHLSRHFNLGDFLSYEKLTKGFANALYHVRTSQGDFVFKIAIRNNPVKVRYEIDLLNMLKGLPVPKPIKTKQGTYLFAYKSHKAFVYPYLRGREATRFTPQMLRDVGKFLGTLHLQTKGFSSSIKRTDFYSISPRKLTRVLNEGRYLSHPKLRKAMSYLKENALRYPLPHGLPRGAMHIDVKPENVLFSRKKLTGVVDFDNSYIGPLVFDLADTLMWFCSSRGRFDMVKAKQIYNGYVRARKLTKLERQSLFTALHNVYLAIALCGVDYLVQKKLPQYFIIWVMDNLLEVEKNMHFSKVEFLKNIS